MSVTPHPSPSEQLDARERKPPWRFARERRLGKRARALVGTAESEIARCLATLGPEIVLEATREDSWALACLGRAADCDDHSAEQEAWVLLAACRPTLVRRAIFGRRLPWSDAGRRTPHGTPSPAAAPAPAGASPVGWRGQLAEIGAQLRIQDS
jgi:hypothetical protein